MLAVNETSAGLMGYRAHRGTKEPQSATYEVAIHGPTLASLRAAAALHKIGVGEAILRAVEDFIHTQGMANLDSPASIITAYHEAVNKGAVYP